MMASRHPVVRSLLLGRECAQDKLFRGINTPFDVLYFQRAFRLDIEVDELDNMVQELSLDLNNLPETLNTISRALSDYVAVHGNGMRGKPGPCAFIRFALSRAALMFTFCRPLPWLATIRRIVQLGGQAANGRL